ncbi:MAG: substrate-binding domain-containing protein [Bacteroidota bacterium]
MSLKEKIRNWVLSNIQNEEWLPGDSIPSISQIVTTFNVSRETVRLSLENLVQRGVLQPRQGKGYFVASHHKISLRVALLCKIDGVYIKPIYQGLIDEMGENISIQVNEIRQSEKTLTSLLEDFVTRQAIDRILVVPISGKEEEIDKILKPFKRRIQVGWIDKAPAETKDPVFLCDYEACVNLAVNHFKSNNIEQLFYFSRNPEDQSIFTKMRNAFKNAVSRNSKTNGIIHDWQHLVSIVNENRNSIGIMAESDTEAVFLLSRLKANGIKIPQQVSIISCDNSEITELVTPSITSVDPGFIELGRKVRMWIQGNYENENSTSPVVYYSSPILILKESSG